MCKRNSTRSARSSPSRPHAVTIASLDDGRGVFAPTSSTLTPERKIPDPPTNVCARVRAETRGTSVDIIDTTCPNCGKTSRAPASSAGKRGRCRGCGGEVLIPDPSVSVFLPKRGTAAASQLPSDPDIKVAPRVPAEPWFYGFLEKYAQVVMGLGLVACGGSVLVGLAGFAMIMGGHASGVDAMTPFLATLGGALGIIPILLAAAPVLLAVDAARNLRALRYGKTGG